MYIKFVVWTLIVTAFFFIGCGKYPVDSNLTSTQQWIDYERYTEFKEIKKYYVAKDYEYVIEKGDMFVRHYAEDNELEVEEIMYLMADSYYRQGRFDSAAYEYGKLIQKFPYGVYRPHSVLGIGNCYRYSQEYTTDQAIEQYGNFITEYPHHALAPAAQFYIGECKYRVASEEVEFTDAVTELKKVLSDYALPLNDEYRRNANLYLGRCYEERPVPDYDLAIMYYTSFTEANTSFEAGDVHYQIGLIYQDKMTGKETEAKNSFYKVVTHYPNSQYYNEALNRYNAL